MIVEEQSTTQEAKPLEVPIPTAPQLRLNNVFQHPASNPLVLDLLLLRKYGPNWLEWEPESLQLALQTDFSGVSDLNLHKVQACRALHEVDSFWVRWEVFVWCTMALNGVFPDFENAQVPTALEMMIAVDVANRIRDDISWSDEVKEYIKHAAVFDGYMFLPKPLDFIDTDAASYGINTDAVQSLLREAVQGKRLTEDSVEAEQVRRRLFLEEQYKTYLNNLRSQLPLVSHVEASLARLRVCIQRTAEDGCPELSRSRRSHRCIWWSWYPWGRCPRYRHRRCERVPCSAPTRRGCGLFYRQRCGRSDLRTRYWHGGGCRCGCPSGCG